LKYFLLFTIITFLTVTPAAAEESSSNEHAAVQTADTNTTDTSIDVIRVEDSSGLTEKEVQAIAKKIDKAESEAIIDKKVKEDNQFTPFRVVPEKKPTVWEDLSPTPVKYDWIELKSGEWLKGHFKAMYDKSLEFDSKEMDLQTFDFEDVKQIRTHRIVTVSIVIEDDKDDGFFGLRQTKIEMTGILRLNEDIFHIIRGDGRLEFNRNQIISIAYGGDDEQDYWSGKINFGLDMRTGNSEKLDLTMMTNFQRRTSVTRLKLDYIGSILNTNDTETANNHRINESFNVFVTKKFFYTPVFSEYFRDKYQNIRNQYTVGIGIGYTFVDTKRVDWDISGGPAILYTEFDTVEEGKDTRKKTGSLELSTSYDVDITKRIDFIFNYKLTLTEKASGSYKHHMVTTLENELTTWLDIDLTFIWDYTKDPEPNADKSVPQQSDLQFLVSLGVDF